MIEFADLIKAAAGSPPRPLDMAVVRQRAARLRVRRRAGMWLGAIIAVVGSGVPVGLGLAPSGDQPTDVGTIDGRVHPQPAERDAPAEPASSDASQRIGLMDSTLSRGGIAREATATAGRPEQTGTPTTKGGEDPSTTDEADDEDGCTRAGPVAAECGEADATACWAARVGCATTTTTSPGDSSR